MAVSVHTITLESRDPHRLAAFWCALLGYEVEPNHTDSVQIGDPAGNGPRFLFAPSTRPKNSRNRIHFDLSPDDQAEAVEHAVSLGASVLPAQHATCGGASSTRRATSSASCSRGRRMRRSSWPRARRL